MSAHLNIDRESYRSTAFNSRIRLLVIHAMNCDFQRGMEILTHELSSHYVIADQSVLDGKLNHHPASPNAPNDSVLGSGASSETLAHRPLSPCARIFELVPEHKRAWHAGKGCWGSLTDVNDRSIGIEIFGVNPPTAGAQAGLSKDKGNHEAKIAPTFTQPEVDATISLCLDILKRNTEIDPISIIGHSDVAVGRKSDPGPYFPWETLHRHGIGAWPESNAVKKSLACFQKHLPEAAIIQDWLRNLGYAGLEVTGKFDIATQQTIKAFQLHWRADKIDGILDAHTAAILEALLIRYR